MILLKYIDQEKRKEQHPKLWSNNIEDSKLKLLHNI